ncbi:hypothetical protein [Rhodopirellula bahusiensis]
MSPGCIWSKAWERRVSKGQVIELSSLRELITEKPFRGWGEDPKRVEAVIKDDAEALALFREAMVVPLREHGGNHGDKEDQGSGTTLNGVRDNDYWHARIQRDCPEELEAIRADEKEILDVRKERGWVSKSKRVTLTGDAHKDRQRLIDAWGEDYVHGLARTIADCDSN